MQPVLDNQTNESYTASFSPDGVSPAFAAKSFNQNALCISNQNPYSCCTGSGTGTCSHVATAFWDAETALTPSHVFKNADVTNGFARIKTAVDATEGGTFTVTVHKATNVDDSPTGDVDAIKIVADANGASIQEAGGAVTQANLPADPVGSRRYCTDCTAASNPCSGGGSGTFAFRINSGAPAWKCL
jgi:hypothetical protein